MANDYLTFQAAQDFLQMSESELQNLVNAGTLRAFRSDGTVKFKKQDLEQIKKETEKDPTVMVKGGETASDDLDVELEDVDETSQTVVGDKKGVKGTEEIVFDDESLETLAVEEDGATAEAELDDSATQELSLSEGATEVMDNALDTQLDVGTDAVDLTRPSRTGLRNSRSVAAVEERHLGYEIALGAALLALTVALPTFYHYACQTRGVPDYLAGIAETALGVPPYREGQVDLLKAGGISGGSSTIPSSDAPSEEGPVPADGAAPTPVPAPENVPPAQPAQ